MLIIHQILLKYYPDLRNYSTSNRSLANSLQASTPPITVYLVLTFLYFSFPRLVVLFVE